MKNANNLPAMPTSEWQIKNMTLRDYFAAKAIPFIQWNKDNTTLCADRCYEIADAMLKARESQ